MRDLLECGGGNLAPFSRFLGEGIVWNKKLRSAPEPKLREMFAEAEEDLGRHVGSPARILIRDFVWMELEDRIKPAVMPARRLPTFLAWSDESRAKAGDLTHQMKVAKGYENGNGFPKDHRRAYFWFAKAAGNGGGDPARIGMNRIRPHLNDADLRKIEEWSKQMPNDWGASPSSPRHSP